MAMNFNWVDWVIIIVAAYYIFEGWEYGLVRLSTNLLSFLGSLWLAIKFHARVGSFFSDKFGLPFVWADVVGYVATAIISEAILIQVFNGLLPRLPEKFTRLKINQLAGAVLSAINVGVIMAFVLVVILALPLRGSARTDIKNSYLGSRLVRLAETYGGEIASSLDQATAEAVRFLTVKPSSNETISLNINQERLVLRIDEVAESRMLELVNAERAKVGVRALKLDTRLRTVARIHSEDMFRRNYFSHYSPEEKDIGDRLDEDGVKYSFAGENLAYAPDVEIAHRGLMDSDGHRKNILEPQFGRVGIGVQTAGPQGTMFTQVFAD